MKDITLPMVDRRLLVYPGDPELLIEPDATATAGNPNSYNTSRLTLSSHAGTHVDAPRHFDSRAPGVDAIDLGALCGPARVVRIPAGTAAIDRAALEPLHDELRGVERLLFRTDNSEQLLPETRVTQFVALTADGARYLREKATQLRLVGLDYISIETGASSDPEVTPYEMPVHNELLRAEPPIYLLEAVDLRAVAPGDYWLVCLPLRIKDGDGAPVRAVLLDDPAELNLGGGRR